METPRRGLAPCNGPSASVATHRRTEIGDSSSTPSRGFTTRSQEATLCPNRTGVRSLDRNRTAREARESSLVTRQAEEEENSFVS
jgi:hypothetical protein